MTPSYATPREAQSFIGSGKSRQETPGRQVNAQQAQAMTVRTICDTSWIEGPQTHFLDVAALKYLASKTSQGTGCPNQ